VNRTQYVTTLTYPIEEKEILQLSWLRNRYDRSMPYQQYEFPSLMQNLCSRLETVDENKRKFYLLQVERGWLVEAGQKEFSFGFMRWRRLGFQRQGTVDEFLAGEDVWYTPDSVVHAGVQAEYREGSLDLPLGLIGKPNMIYGVREKIDGIRFDRYDRGDRSYMCGPFEFEVPYGIGISSLEMYDGVFFILYPYRVVPFSLDSIQFEAHPWLKEVEYPREGVMVLTRDREYRLKRAPTIEVEVRGGCWLKQPKIKIAGTEGTGVMEIAYDHEFSEFYWVGDRPCGKINDDIWSVTLCPSLSMWPDIRAGGQLSFGLRRYYDPGTNTLVILEGEKQNHVINNPGNNVYVQNIHLFDPISEWGEWRITRFSVRWEYNTGTTISFIEFPLYLDVHLVNERFERWKIKNRMNMEGGVLVGFPIYDIPLLEVDQLQGSKLIMYDVRGSVAYYAEKGKKLDHPGGKREIGETYRECLERELEEELHWTKKEMEKITFVGYSRAKGVETAIFELQCNRDDYKKNSKIHWFHFHSHNPDMELFQAWYPRNYYTWANLHTGVLRPQIQRILAKLSIPGMWEGRKFHVRDSEIARVKEMFGYQIEVVGDEALRYRKWIVFHDTG